VVYVLHTFIAANRDEIIRRCRAKVASRSMPPSSEVEIDHGVPVFLDQLTEALRLGELTSPEIAGTALLHGHDLLRQGCSVSQVVHDYGDVCQSITELAVASNAPISTEDFRTLNRCLDDAIAGAVTEYGRERNLADVEGEAARGSERLGFFAHELRNLINTALGSFEVLKTGNVGTSGSTGTVLRRSLMSAQALISRSLAEVRLAQGVQNRERFLVAGFIEELAPAATLEANARGLELTVMPVEDGVVIEGDRQILTAVVGNLLQNAFKFTRPRTTVTLRVGASAERVLIEVQDECGGLPSGNVSELFSPFEQRSADRTAELVSWTGVQLQRLDYEPGAIVFAQGDPATSVMHVEKGAVRLSVLSHSGKEAVVAVVDVGHFFGEGCLAGQLQRMATATAIVQSTILAVDKQEMVRQLRTRPAFADRFLTHMLTRNIRIEEDLIDQLFNSTEKRLARTLLLLARYGEPEASHRALPKMSQQVLAEMVGTTRSRVNFFMNKFRKRGLIDYNGDLKINNSLLSVVLRD